MAQEKKRYTINYSSTTGYGWKETSNSLSDYTSLIKMARNRDYYMHLVIWDDKKKDFVFWKRALQYTPDIDLLKY